MMECPVCNSRERKKRADIGGAVLWTCSVCGLLMNDVKKTPVEGEYYKSDYDELYGTYYKGLRRKQFATALENMESIDFSGRRLLDVGCSYGWFMEIAEEKGWNASGIEPSPRVFKTLRSKGKRDVYNYDIDLLHEVPGTFDLITLWNVFEHIKDPRVSLADIKEKLNDSGVLLVCVPDLKGLITRLSFLVYKMSFGKKKDHLWHLYQMDNDFPHIYHYNRGTLSKILKENGFSPITYWRQPIVDRENIKERIKGYIGKDRLKGLFMGFALKCLCDIARLTGKEDELVIVARRA